MRTHRFFVNVPLSAGKTMEIENPDLINQWRNVFRFKVGDRVILFDGSGFDFLCDIANLTKQNATFSILQAEKNTAVPKREVLLYCSLVKKDKFEWILEKGTEIGVSHFIPLLSERSEKKNLNFERATRIIVEAAEQSGHAVLPVLQPVISLKDAIQTLSAPAVVFDVVGAPFLGVSSKKSVAVFVGPEGGWSDNERKFFEEKNIPSYTLGTMTLKTETAALAAAVILLVA